MFTPCSTRALSAAPRTGRSCFPRDAIHRDFKLRVALEKAVASFLSCPPPTVSVYASGFV